MYVSRHPLQKEEPRPLNRTELLAMLPKVGDQRWEVPTIDDTTGVTNAKASQRCVVVAVHPGHLWYTVQFENGFRESYKMPKYRTTQEVRMG